MTAKKYLSLAFFFSLTLFITMLFRKYPVDFPQLETEARRKIDASLRYQMTQNINKHFPGLSALAREQLINVAISEYKSKNREQLQQDLVNGYRMLKEKYQDSSGRTYLMELDCWHWARYTENVFLTGHPGDTVVGGKQVDNLMVAPLGSPIPFNQLLFYLSARLYKVFTALFHSTLPVFNFVFYLPLFYFEVFILILYLCCFYRWGNLGATVTCLFVGLSPLFLRRSCAGWFDMDIFCLLFPFLIVWVYIAGENKLTVGKRSLALLGAGLLSGLFAFIWLAWWFIYVIIAIYEILSIVMLLFSGESKAERSKQEASRVLYYLGFLLSSAIWILIFCGTDPLTTLYCQIKGTLSLNDPVAVSVWPNTYATVSELKKAGLKDIVQYLGAVPFAASVISLTGFLLFAWFKRKKDKFEWGFACMMLCWFLMMFFACFKGTRFIMFLIIPLGVALGAGSSISLSFLKRKNLFAAIGLFLAVCTIIVNMIFSAQAVASSIYPMMEDRWYQFLLRIEKITPKDSIINSWWDYGDWFKAVAHRKVIFDGQSQNTPQAYWMAHALMTSNETEAVNTLRMLNNGGNRAFEIINSELKDPFASALLLRQVITLNREQARLEIRKVISPLRAEEVTQLIFDRPKNNSYFVVDYEMPRKIASISFLGTWDFAKAFLSKYGLKLGKDKSVEYLIKHGVDKKQADIFFQEFSLIAPEKFDSWIARPMRFYGGPFIGEEKDGQVLFSGGLFFNPVKKTVMYYSEDENKYKVPRSLFILNKEKLEEVRYPNANIDISVLVLKTRTGYLAHLLPQQLASSMMSRLYFLGGAGLKHFKHIFSEGGDSDNLRIFEIDWGK